MLKQSLTLRVLATCFLFLVIPLLVYSFIYFNRAFEDLLKRADGNLEQAAFYRTISLKETAPFSRNFLKELKHLLDLENTIKQLPNAEFTTKLKNLTGSIKGFDVYVLGPGKNDRYQILAADIDHPKQTGIGPDYFISYSPLKYSPLETGKDEQEIPYNFIRFYFSEEEQRLIPYVYSVYNIRDSQTGYVEGSLLLQKDIESEMATILYPLRATKQPIDFGVLDYYGFIPASSEKSLVGQHFMPLSEEKKRQLLEQLNLSGKNFFSKKTIEIKKSDSNPNLFEFVWKGQVQLAALPPHRQMGDQIFAFTPKKLIFKQAIEQFLVFYIAFGLIIILGAGLTFLLTKWFSHPLVQITNLMQKIREGNFKERFYPEKLGFELNDLGLAFNKMLNALLENMQRAEDERVKKEAYRKEIDIGKKVQKGLLPKHIPHVEGAELSSFYFPANDVGGDFYDYFIRDNNLYMICVDTSGLGLSPCLYSLDVRSFFRAYGLMHSDVAELMRLVNNAFYEDTGDTGMFATSIACIYHINSRALSYYAAGHIPGIIKKKNGEIILLEKRGIALGVIKAEEYTSETLYLESEDILLLFTEGLIDTTNAKNQKFTMQKVIDLLQMRAWNSAQEISQGLVDEVIQFIGEARTHNEFALIVLKIT